MIKKLTLKNFKGVGNSEVEVEFKPITLLFGPNSAGKSTIIQALHYLKEIFERRNFDPINTQTGGRAIDLGGFRSLVNSHDLKKTIELKLILEPNYYDIDESSISAYAEEEQENGYDNEDNVSKLYNRLVASIISSTHTYYVKVSIAWHPNTNKVYTKKFEFGINDLPFLIITESRNTGTIIYYKISYINFYHPVLISSFSEEIIDFYQSVFLSGYVEPNELKNVDIEIVNLYSAIPDWKGDFKFKDELLDRVLWQSENGKDAVRFLDIIKNVINNYGNALNEELKKIRYLGPVRDVPSREYARHHYTEEERWSSGLAAWDAVYEGFPHINVINDWLEKLKTGYRLELRNYKEVFYGESSVDIQKEVDLKKTHTQIIELFDTFAGELDSNQDNIIREINQILLQLDSKISFNSKFDKLPPRSRLYLIDKSTGVDVLPFDVGIGISQVFPVIIACLMQYSSILAIEQPELHIHPAIQVELADLFISQTNKRQFICLLETHSEHIMLRILRRIEERKESLKNLRSKRFYSDDEMIADEFTNVEDKDDFNCNADKVNVYWFEPKNSGLEVSRLPIDDSGEFTIKWPHGFFEERAEELFPDE